MSAWRTLTEELADLERTDPWVHAAARKYQADIRRILSAAVSEANRSQRWPADDEVSRDLDELAARRRRNEVDRYATKAAQDEARGDDAHDKDLRGGF